MIKRRREPGEKRDELVTMSGKRVFHALPHAWNSTELRVRHAQTFRSSAFTIVKVKLLNNKKKKVNEKEKRNRIEF